MTRADAAIMQIVAGVRSLRAQTTEVVATQDALRVSALARRPKMK